MIETRKTEERYITSDTGQVVSIERNEVLFERGDLIDQDRLAQIRFSMQADGVLNGLR